MMNDGWRAVRLLSILGLSCIINHSSSIIAYAALSREPTVSHGAGQVVRGVVVEMPKGVIEGTLGGPPVVGTAMGLLGGTMRALQVTVAGFVEMAQGVHPFEDRRR
jgi:hypothetical protein